MFRAHDARAWQTDKTRVATFMMAKEVSMRTPTTRSGCPMPFTRLSHHQKRPLESWTGWRDRSRTWHSRDVLPAS